MAKAFDRLPLGALRVFEAVASRLSFSAAADALNVTPAAVSQQIKSLEDYLQVPLFRRNGRRVEVTDEGLELLPGVRSGLDQLEAALQHIRQHQRGGPLQVSLLASFLQMWLLPRIRAFRRKSPDVHLRFHTSRELVDFARAPIHVALRFGRGDYPNLHVEKLLDEAAKTAGKSSSGDPAKPVKPVSSSSVTFPDSFAAAAPGNPAAPAPRKN